MKTKPPSYFDENVFVNCPLDDEYIELFQAIIFAIHRIGFRPRCALELKDSGHNRLQKILDMIGDSRYGIHDISRTELDKKNKLPRFNMPFELGLDIGFRHSGNEKCKTKVHLVLDRHQYRYQKFISDIAGQDISAHNNKPIVVVTIVRDWLRTPNSHLPSGSKIFEEYKEFRHNLPKICKLSHLQVNEINFADYSYLVAQWLSKTKAP